MKNTRYAKLLDDGNIKYAENIIHGKFGVILNPSEKQYMASGFFPIEDTMPAPKPDCKWIKDKWMFDSKEKKIKATYRAVDAVIYENSKKEVKLNPFRRLVRAIVYWAAGK